ncbi:MAG: family 16 glycosylhydrolase [Chitinophagaceae bacterium]
MERLNAASLLILLLPAISVVNTTAGSPHSDTNIAAKTSSWDTVIDARSFAGYAAFEEKWNYLYPWGADHNGSARMYAGSTDHSQVTLTGNNTLRLTAGYITADEGKSSKPPFQPIRYHSGSIYAKHQVTITEEYPEYEVSGSFKAPITKGTWPAFWLTAVKGWPPELDILEFKGDSLNWQNSFITPQQVSTIKTALPDALKKWHHYKAVLKRVDEKDLDIFYYVDNRQTGVHRCNFTNKPLWIIINLQMEGSAGSPGPQTSTEYYIKDILVRRLKNNP